MRFNNRNVFIGENVQLGKNVKIGDNTSIFDNVIIGDNTIICDFCIIGEPTNDFYYNRDYNNRTLKIGADSIIRSHSIIYSGSDIGDGFQMGHYSVIRENNQLGAHCMVGGFVTILNGCKIGNYVRFHSYDEIGENSEIEDFVFFYPNVIVATDPTPPSDTIKSCHFGAYSQITSDVMILPGTNLGKHCVVAAQSHVSGVFEDYSFITGNPAKKFIDVRKMPMFNNETKRRQYPWPYNFSRNMPWKECGYDEWLKEQER